MKEKLLAAHRAGLFEVILPQDNEKDVAEVPENLRSAMKMHFIGGWGGFQLVGSKDQIVDGLAKLSALGLDGVVVSWPRYIEDMRWFERNVHPLMQQAGLR